MAKQSSSMPDTIVSFRNSQRDEAQGTLMRLNRNSIVFEVYNPYSIVQLSEVLESVRIRRGERDIYSGRAVVTNMIHTGLMLIVSASLVDPWSDLVDLTPGPELRDEVEAFVDDWAAGNQQLRPSYQLAVSNVCNFLEELSRWLDHGEMVAGITEPDAPPDLVGEFVQDVDAMVGPKIDELFAAFEAETHRLGREEVPLHKSFARREIHPLTLCSPFMHRTYTKPLGYAGDYQMVNMILADPFQGSNTYAKIINSFLLRTGPAKAHRNRIDKLSETLVAEARRVNEAGRPFRVLNVGCGPAAEVQRFVKNSWLADRTVFELIDFNKETLDFAEQEITAAIRENRRRTEVKFVQRSVHELLKEAARRNRTDEPQYDFVYCAGLFDYLGDRVCGRLLDLFHSWTVPGGFILTTNVHTSQPTRGFMEHLNEWNLVLRDEQDLLSLAPGLGHQTACTEATGVNAFLEIRKADE